MFSYSLLICNSFSVFPCFNLYWEFWGRCRHVFCGIFLNLSLIFFWWLDWGYLYQYELVDIYFILWVIIHITLFILFKLFHLWPFSLSLFHIGSSVFLWYPHFFFFGWKTTCYVRLTFWIPYFDPRISHFPKNLCLLFLDGGI